MAIDADRRVRVRAADARDRPFLVALAPRLVASSPSRWRSRRRMLADYVQAIDNALRPCGSRSGLLLAESDNAMPRGFALLVAAADQGAQAMDRHVSQMALVDEHDSPVRHALIAAMGTWAHACGSTVLGLDDYWRCHPAFVARSHRPIGGETR